MIILGIDPGSLVTGFGVIETEGNKEKLLAQGIIRLNPTDSHQNRLRRIYQEIAALIQLHLPDTCAIEMPIYGKNAQSMLKLGRAQAAAMLASLNHQVPVTEYTPKEVKKAVTGNGNASKEQVRYMICSILSIAETETVGLDASDALAVGLCHLHRCDSPVKKRHGSWESFIRANPGRIV
ncbi:MAG: crossover junction endodeoxyribonuclease RuvC [Bacteroidetes bacterium]|nr:MAG: crossover junction endodeoxyribonuclease RuvC [Bacteroidota bacterium]